MKHITTLLTITTATILGLFIGSTYCDLSPLNQPIQYATALVRPTKGNTVSGVVHFTQTKEGVMITANFKNLTPGEHGFHVHEFGDCNCDDAVCTGGHFNPTKTKHGAPNQPDSHIGDLGNIVADEKGDATYNELNQYIKLNGPHSIIGRAIIIHANADDLKTQPTGDAGARIGSGVIGISKQ